MSEVEVRPIKPSDWEEWLPIWRGYHLFYKNDPSDDVTRTTWARFFDEAEPVHALVAERTGHLVGIATPGWRRRSATCRTSSRCPNHAGWASGAR